MSELSWGAFSKSVPGPPRGDLPVIIEETFDDHRDRHARWLEFYRTLPAPFQRVLDVELEESGVKVTAARFLGVGGLSLVHALEATGRVLPLDVWLTLTSTWGTALLQVPEGNDGWKTPASLTQLGVDVRGELVLTFDEPNHVVGRAWIDPENATKSGPLLRIPESISPEAVRGIPLLEASRVYSLAIALLGFLEGRRQFSEHESMLGMLGAIALEGLKWGEPRHPDVNKSLEEVMRRATQRQPSERLQSLPEFLSAVKAAAGVEPASEQRMIDVLSGISPELQSCLERLDPQWLPASWREGGIQVMQDRLLERLVPITALPAARI